MERRGRTVYGREKKCGMEKFRDWRFVIILLLLGGMGIWGGLGGHWEVCMVISGAIFLFLINEILEIRDREDLKLEIRRLGVVERKLLGRINDFWGNLEDVLRRGDRELRIRYYRENFISYVIEKRGKIIKITGRDRGPDMIKLLGNLKDNMGDD